MELVPSVSRVLAECRSWPVVFRFMQQACKMAGEMRGGNLYREVLLQIEQNSCQELEIDSGSLSDVTIKTDGHTKSGAGGGFAYKDSTRVESFGRNRFIHW